MTIDIFVIKKSYINKVIRKFNNKVNKLENTSITMGYDLVSVIAKKLKI